MLFTSQKFLYFFTIIFVVYWSLPWRRVRVWLLLGASFYFYASWNQWLAALIGISTTVDYLIARALEAGAWSRWRKHLLTVSIAANLGLLCYFKYANFFLRSLEEALGAAEGSLPLLKVLLPIGISFYTFEAINYVVDVYRGRIRAERNLLHFMLFITFFPHLVAGPIVRARDFLPQIRRPKRWDWVRMELGLQFLIMGLFKKLALADRLALFVDPVFGEPTSYATGAVWLALLAYTLQIYCDFSGYTDMALGTAHLLGYKLAQNFNLPYLATNISEFWRRWHISLSSWLRDYLFIPLGGSRGSKWQTNRNLLVTMTLGGLWHGANWTFIVWGVLHGVLLIVHRSWRTFCQRRPPLDKLLQTAAGSSLCLAVTFLSVSAGWVLFRAPTLGAAVTIFQRLVVPHGGLAPPLRGDSLWVAAAVVALCSALVHWGIWKRLTLRLPASALGLGYAIAVILIMVLIPDLGRAFIYFQF
jgi:alginate O-acetyltransferase complex protein AlgI